MDPLCPLGQALECSVCLEQLDNTSRVLPCQHTFCKKCLLDIVNTHKELRCPECRVLVTVPFDQLPPNILLMRILEGMKNIPHSTEESSTNGFCDKFASFDAFKASSQMANTDSTTSVLTSMGANVQSSSIATILSSSELIRTCHTSQSASFPSQPPPASTSQSFPSTMFQPFQSSLSYSIPTTLIQAMSSSTPNIRASSQLLTPANTVQDNFSSSGVSSISLYSLTRPCSSSDSLMQTNPRTEISLITNSVNTQNIQVVSSLVATPPIPSVISPLVSAGTHSNSCCIQTGTTQSGVLNNFSASSSSSIPPFQANFNLLPSTSSATEAPSGLSSHMLQFDSSLRVSHSSLPSSDSGVELKSLPTSLSNNLQNLNYASNPSLENSVQSGPSSEMASGSYSNTGIVQNLESHAPSTIRSVTSEKTQNLSNSRAEEQFRICSSLIEKGTPMVDNMNSTGVAVGDDSPTPGSLLDEFEEAFQNCLAPLTKEDPLSGINQEELKANAEANAQRFHELAHRMEAAFLQKRFLLSVQRPELLIMEENQEIRNQISQKDELIKKQSEKLTEWQSTLENLITRVSVPSFGQRPASMMPTSGPQSHLPMMPAGSPLGGQVPLPGRSPVGSMGMSGMNCGPGSSQGMPHNMNHNIGMTSLNQSNMMGQRDSKYQQTKGQSL